MLKKLAIAVLSLILIVLISGFLFQYSYLKPLKAEAEIEFDKDYSLPGNPDILLFQPTRAIIISFKYPILKSYFLENFEIIPRIEGNFVFSEALEPPLHILGYKEIQFFPESVERDTTYKVKNFEKEFSFSLPSPKPREISFSEEKKEIVITFFDSIEEDYFFEKFSIKPKTAGEYIFSDSNKKVIFKPKIIEEDKNYELGILGKNISFKIESPKTKDVYFNEAKKEIVMTFTKQVDEKRFFENFKSTPSLKGKLTLDDSQTNAVFKANNIKVGTSYKVEILGKSLKFKIEPPPEPKPTPKPTPKLTPKPEPQPKLASGEKLIDIDISEQKLRLYQGGKTIAEYTTSTGKSGMPTPTGEFKILSKENNHWSAAYSLYMPYSMRFYKGYYIHELPYWPGGYREGEDHLGIPVSHGCVRVGVGSAEKVYNFADIGTKLTIHQ